MIKATRIPVNSSMLSAIAYDKKSETLFAEFVNTGKIYAYEKVEPEMFEELQEARSIGRYFRLNILRMYGDYKVKRNRDIKW
jgi:hypothetical protein